MVPTNGLLKMLRIGLLVSAIGWGISLAFTFSSWEHSSNQLYEMGAELINYQPLLDYWLKMASSVFGCIGIASALACWHPDRYMGMIRLLVPFHLFVGGVLLSSALLNNLNPTDHPTFIADISFCFISAALIGFPLVKTQLIAGKMVRK